MKPMLSRQFIFDTSLSKQELGMQYIDAKRTLIEMAYRMIELGYVPRKGTLL